MFRLRAIFRTFFLLSFFLLQNSWAKSFTSQYAEFELPNGWVCSLEGTEWVCQSENKDRQKEAIIILAAKIRGEQDSLDGYTTYLKAPKSFTLPGGKSQVSEAKYTKMENINNQQWVDSLHLASEVPGFYTRYLATIKEDLGVAVTFSVGKDFYDSYKGVFDKIIATLRVFRQAGGDASKFALKSKDDNLLENSTLIPEGQQKFDISQAKKGGGSGGLGTTGMGLGALGVIVVVMMMMKKKKKVAKKK